VSPNLGQLLTVGSLGITLDPNQPQAFDIDQKNNAFAALTPTGATTSSFYTINLQTGAAKLLGPIGGATPVSVLAIAIVNSPVTVYATDGTNLLTFNAGKPNTGVMTRPFTGLAQGELGLTIDQRAATGQFYGLTSNSRLVRINTSTGAVTQVGGGPVGMQVSATVELDGNPQVDRLRVVNGTQNFRLNPDNSAVVTTAPQD